MYISFWPNDAVLTKLCSSNFVDNSAQLYIGFIEELGTDIADLVDDEPSPLQNSLRICQLVVNTFIMTLTSIEYRDTSSMMYGVSNASV